MAPASVRLCAAAFGSLLQLADPADGVNMEMFKVDPWIAIVDVKVDPADACIVLSPAMGRVVAMAP
jgi:hypothetical protein